MKTNIHTSPHSTSAQNRDEQLQSALMDQVIWLLRHDQGMPSKKLCSSVRFRVGECEPPNRRSAKARPKRAAKAKGEKRRQPETPTTSDPAVLSMLEGPLRFDFGEQPHQGCFATS